MLEMTALRNEHSLRLKSFTIAVSIDNVAKQDYATTESASVSVYQRSG